MTTGDPAPFWPAGEDWTGFLLVIVPVGPLPVPEAELGHQVRARIEADPVLCDLVTVGLAAPLERGAGWERGLLTSVVAAARPDGHFFAPRGLIAVVVVADERDTVGGAFDALRALPPEYRLWDQNFGVIVRPGPGTGVSVKSVDKLFQAVTALVETFDEQPQLATAETAFHHRVDELFGHRRPEPGARPAPRPDQAVRPAPDRRPRRPDGAPPRPGPPERPMLDPVMYDGAEIVTVDERTAVQRLRRQSETDADCLDALRHDGRAVALVSLVFVPDDGTVPRAVTKRRNAIALELDQAFASVGGDALTGAPAQAAVEVFAATNPVRKHGVLRRAGEATESVLPKVEIEYFSVGGTLPPLLVASQRTARALLARGVDVVSHHFVFLAAMTFPADASTTPAWVELLDQARVTWIDFGTADHQVRPDSRLPRSPSGSQVLSSPFGLHVLTDKEDVLATVTQQSEVLYRYVRPAPSGGIAPVPADEPAAGPPAAERRRWSIRKRATE